MSTTQPLAFASIYVRGKKKHSTNSANHCLEALCGCHATVDPMPHLAVFKLTDRATVSNNFPPTILTSIVYGVHIWENVILSINILYTVLGGKCELINI